MELSEGFPDSPRYIHQQKTKTLITFHMFESNIFLLTNIATLTTFFQFIRIRIGTSLYETRKF
jgi:hypothetical protein